MIKPQVSSQLMSQTGMGRPGGMASRGSKSTSPTMGSNLAAMQNALLRKGVKTPAQAKKVSSGGKGAQFFNKAAGGDMSISKPRSNSTPKPAKGPMMAKQPSKQHPGV